MEFIEAKVGAPEPSPTTGGPQDVPVNPPHPGNQGAELIGETLVLGFEGLNTVEAQKDVAPYMATHNEGLVPTGSYREQAGHAKADDVKAPGA